VLVVVLVLENPDRFAIRLTEQISSRKPVSLRSTESQYTEDEHDDEDDSKFRRPADTPIRFPYTSIATRRPAQDRDLSVRKAILAAR
jgi:hypothetical protein